MNAAEAPQECDVLVVGAGAAGLFCAAEAGARGRRAVVLEHGAKPGQKIAISGGGRCNFTNLHAAPENYLSAQPDFPKSALARYTPEDFLEGFVKRHGIAWHEKKLGQLFCDGSARQITDALLADCAEAGARVTCDCRVESVHRDAAGGPFTVRTTRGTWTTAALVIATGGLSFPKLGATDFAYRVARQFGLRVTALRAGLVPLTAGDEATRTLCGELSGVSIPCVARAGANGGNTRAFRENLLFTHRGVSGPAVLQISSYLPAAPGDAAAEVAFDLLPDVDAADWLGAARGRDVQLGNLLAEKLPARFAAAFARPFGAEKPVRRLGGDVLAQVARALHRWTLRPGGTEGYPKAEVTLGGIDTRDLHSKTLAARAVPGLYFIGECVDVTGQLGGYNFQWAWASAHAAGQAA